MKTGPLSRNGETLGITEEIFRGRVDIPLNDHGIAQARQTAEALRGLPVEAIYCSPLSRALMTAQEFGKVFNLQPVKIEAFTDISFGAWEGMSVAEVKQRYPREFASWEKTPHLGIAPDGESLAAVRERAWRKLQELAAAGQEQGMFMVVTHRVVLKLLLLAALGLPDGKFWDLQQDPCAVNVLKLHGERWILNRFNETCAHMDLSRGIAKSEF